ncbi:aminoglycoside phosphotransferase family protein [Actinophytocola oryzae]|uniref:Streptomycin 6-kinase n=1 Tax=Actinophytocola oryzae TaxID=502181 RepID=A0A4R7VJR6_9PSEU|nr:aminoglycoside phosphotransferase family protein [Actinophytocola oryzae]TDV49693.1 streptomycin 6-kinase [Actinophytocola oryzae]
MPESVSRPSGAVLVPDRVARSVRALGAAGERWLAGLRGLLAELEAEWSITVGGSLAGGQAAYVATVVGRDGRQAVLKAAIPMGIDALTPFERELTALRLMGGDPYAELLRYDVGRRVLLLERLGEPMAALGWPPERQADALVGMAARGWRPAPADVGLPTGAEAARWLADFVATTWERLGGPCPEATVDLAVRCAAAREAAFDPRRATLVHGDVHAFNALRSGAGFRLVDPEGLVSEPEHDLGVIQARGVQAWTDDLATSEPRQALEVLTRRCARAGRQSGTDPAAIWQWAFTELVSTGLFLLSLGHTTEAEPFLAAADNLTTATPGGSP